MQISAKADYAVRALVELAADSGRPLTCEGIASAQDIPFRFLKSVFRDLRRAGLVRSQRGCEGGYWIGRDPAAISVAEVMTAVDGEFLTLRGASPETLRYPGAARGLPDLWHAAGAAARSVLDGTTIAALAAEASAAPVPAGAAGTTGAMRTAGAAEAAQAEADVREAAPAAGSAARGVLPAVPA